MVEGEDEGPIDAARLLADLEAIDGIGGPPVSSTPENDAAETEPPTVDEDPPADASAEGALAPAEATVVAPVGDSGMNVGVGVGVEAVDVVDVVDDEDEGGRSRAAVAAIAVGALLLVALAAVGAITLVGSLADDDETAEPVPSSSTAAPSSDDEADEADEAEAPEEALTTTSSTGVVTTIADREPSGIDSLTGEPWPESLEGLTRTEIEALNYPRSIVVGSSGEVRLEGRVPSREVADDAVAQASLGGALSVTDNFDIDPDIPVYPTAPVYADEVVNFDLGSIDVAEEFLTVLDLGVLALTLNPGAVGVIVAHTDATGTPEDNLQLANDRASAVRDYWIANGVPEDRIRIDARGEEFATVDADEETAARDRRVEFAFEGFFG